MVPYSSVCVSVVYDFYFKIIVMHHTSTSIMMCLCNKILLSSSDLSGMIVTSVFYSTRKGNDISFHSLNAHIMRHITLQHSTDKTKTYSM